MSKQKYTGSFITLMFLIVLTAALILVNFIAAELPPLRLDLTSGAQYSLSDATRKIIGSLADRVKVDVYFTRDLPSPYNRHAAYVRDLLEEYSTYARGNLAYEFIDPGTDEAKKREVVMKGIPAVQIQEIKNDQIGIKQVFMGIVVTYGTKQEAIPLVRRTEDLEYALTGSIKKLTAPGLKTVAFAKGHGEPAIDEKMRRLKGELEKNYRVVTQDFNSTKDIPADVTTLVVVAPSQKWSDEDIFHLDQFIMRGGTAAFLLSSVQVDIHQFTGAEDVDNGLHDVLASYGITPEKNLVVDPNCGMINVETQQGSYRIRNIISYPYIPLITDLNRDHVLTKDIGKITFPFLSSLTLASNRPGLNYTALARTSNKSWQESGTYNLNPMERKTRPQNVVDGPFNAAAIASGKFPGFFAKETGEGRPDFIKDPAKVLKESPETRILVVGTGYFGQDEFADEGGMIFLINAIDWLAQDSDMITIRSRGLSERPISDLQPLTKQCLRYANMLGVPLLFVIFGIVRWQLRKAKLRNFKL